MKIAYDASLISGQSGIERYTQELLRAMLRRADGDDVQVVGDRGQGPLLDTLLGQHEKLSIVDAMLSEHRVPKPLRPLVRIFRQHQLSGAVRSADVVHLLGPQKIVPRARKLAVTIHDLFPLDPSMELHSVLVRRFPARITRQLKAADMVMTPSTYVAGTIREHFPWYTGPIRVTPLAADAVFAPTPLSEATTKIYGITKPYVIFIGRVDGRKNLRRILAAWRSLPQALRSEADLVLLIPGSDHAIASLRAEHSETFADPSVRLCSNVPLGQMVELLSAARALVFTTLGEGFGLPVVEAMQCGCPVITSNCTALPEVGGNAALYADPRDVEAIADQMRRCLMDEELVERMRHEGLLHAQSFSWDKTAAVTHEAYQQIVG
jgi:alpha-1,3-rhamnosyl/mannosyltransferase